MKKVIRIGSRESYLAVTQTQLIMKAIQKAHPELELQLITMKTTGDKILDRNLDQIGGKGLFVKELDRALLNEEIDLSIHSLKDLPMEISDEIPLVGFSKREDPRDALILKEGIALPLKEGIVGSSSRRRMIQLKAMYPHITGRGIRGNVQTRLKKLEEEDYIATILAAAGLKRLGMAHLAAKIFSVDEMLPAAGQGILAVQGRKGEDYSYLECIKDEASEIAAQAERSFVTTLDGGCSSPIAAYAEVKGNEVKLRGLYYHEAAEDFVVGDVIGDCKEAMKLGESLALKLKKKWD